MSGPPNFCENRDGLICQGVNGFKSIVEGFTGDGDRTSASPTPSDTPAPQTTPPPPELVTSAPDAASEATPPPLPPPPPPPVIVTSTPPPETVVVSVTPPASTVTSTAIPPPELAPPPPQEATTSSFPQLILPTPVLLTTTSSRGSFIESLPTRTATTLNPVNNPLVPSIFASSDFNSPIVGPATTFISQPTDAAIATPLTSAGATQGAISDRSTSFPAALVAGVSGGVIAFVVIFALLWRRCLRRQSEQRHAHNVANEKGLSHIHDRPFNPPVDRGVTTEIWTTSQPSKSDQTRLSWAATEVSLGTDLEPLSPKPVIQQTVHRMSVPVPVEASSFRNSSKEGSLRGSLSRPTSTNQQTSSREASASQGTENTQRSSARLQVPGAARLSSQHELPTQSETTEEDSEPDLVPAPLQKKGEGTGLQRQYTLRNSPLHQNPFQDPVEEESPAGTPASLTFEIVNADTPPARASVEPESGAQGAERQESPLSPIHVLQTITLTAEDLKRASTARSVVSTRTRRGE